MLKFLFKEKKQVIPCFSCRSGGFTLVELLAVLAIISLLVAVVLVSMGQSKNRARDAVITTSLMEIRNAAEFLYDKLQASYEGVCDSTDTTLSSDGDFGRIKAYIEKQRGFISCKDSETAYAVISTLNAADCWCIDSLGVSKEVSLEPDETCSDKLLTTVCP